MVRWFESLIDPFRSDRLGQPPSGLLAFYWRYVGQAWGYFVFVMVMAGLLSVIGAALYVFVGLLIDRMELSPDPSVFVTDNLWLLAGIAVLILVIEPIIGFAHLMVFNQALVPAFTNLVRWQTHRFVLRQSVSYFQDDFAGRIANKVMQTSLALRRSVMELVDAVWYVAVFVFSALAILADQDLRLALPLAIWIVAYGLTLRVLIPQIKSASTASSEAYSRLMGRIVDSYTNIQTVKLFGHARREDSYARAGISEHLAHSATLMRGLTLIDVLVGFLNGLMLVTLAGLAITLWSDGEITVGTVAAALGLALRVTNMSFWIMFVATGIAENMGVVREGADAIAKPHTVVDVPNARTLRVQDGEIRFESISFHYGANRSAKNRLRVIEDLSLAIAPGEKVAIVGRSGAGKSTLVQLLLRFHDLEDGRILIDGQDIATVEQESLRECIGMVTQDTSLLHRSVLDNIRYGQPEAGFEQAVEAAKQAHAHDFILGLRDPQGRRGYDAHVGERGVKLSGGQRQRIAIARVLLKNAPILILDEATSALDSEVEAAIQEQLFNLMADKTVIAIAHRLSTIAAMDRLIILDEGQVIEEGTHDELQQRGDLYANLWNRQSRGFLATDKDVGT